MLLIDSLRLWHQTGERTRLHSRPQKQALITTLISAQNRLTHYKTALGPSPPCCAPFGQYSVSITPTVGIPPCEPASDHLHVSVLYSAFLQGRQFSFRFYRWQNIEKTGLTKNERLQGVWWGVGGGLECQTAESRQESARNKACVALAEPKRASLSHSLPPSVPGEADSHRAAHPSLPTAPHHSDLRPWFRFTTSGAP